MSKRAYWRGSMILVLSIGLLAACSRTPLSVRSMQVDPTVTGEGIVNDDESGNTHYVLQANGHGRKNLLVVFLGGSGSVPSDYTTISESAAGLGFAVIDLRFPNDTLLDLSCNTDVCYTNQRGETAFGGGVAYRDGQPVYRSLPTNVNLANSIVGRLVSSIDYLANYGQGWDAGYWRQFLVPDSRSPYVTTHEGAVYPDWSKIVLAGHSQGGGDAAFIAMRLPADSPVRRVVMFSTPDDNVGGVSASWVTDTSATPMSRFWGMRAPTEGDFGSFVTTNWQNMGGAGNGGVGGSDEADRSVGDGGESPAGAHRLILESSGEDLTQHNSTAANDSMGLYPPKRDKAWYYLFTGGGKD